MKKIYIVKRAPEHGKIAGNSNNVYTRDAAFSAAERYAAQSKTGETYVIFEAIGAFRPIANVQRVEITEE